MKLTLIKKLDSGAFGDVWRAKDELERDVAVKIIRPANEGVANALAHAKALARATHPNVVAVLTLERIADPDSGDRVDCVVMELICGETLSKMLEGTKLSRADAETIGLGIIQGLAHIHAQGMAHGDLHEENVMIAGGIAKVIDILYLDTLASLSTEKRSTKLHKDLLSLRIILQQLIIHSELDSAEATEFNNLLETDATIQDIEAAYLQILSPENSESDERAIEHAYARLTEDNFVEGEDYAMALAEETPDAVVLPLLERLISNNSYDPQHEYYVALIWEKLPTSAQSELIQKLGNVLDVNLPKGKWSPSIRLLKLFGPDGWSRLSQRIRIKIEGLIVKDVLAGFKDIHSAKKVSGGVLGTHALSLWRQFSKPEILADNLISLLKQNWYTQNYVGEFFLRRIPSIASETKKKVEFIQAIKVAVANDARLIVNGIDELPADWVAAIRAEDA